MTRNLIYIGILLILEAGMGYYSLVVNGSLFSRFLFFLLSAAIVCLIVLKGIRYILPSENEKHYRHVKTPKNKKKSKEGSLKKLIKKQSNIQ